MAEGGGYVTDEELELCQTLAEEACQSTPDDVLAPPAHYESEKTPTAPATSTAPTAATTAATATASASVEGVRADMIQSPSKEVLIADNSSRRRINALGTCPFMPSLSSNGRGVFHAYH